MILMVEDPVKKFPDWTRFIVVRIGGGRASPAVDADLELEVLLRNRADGHGGLAGIGEVIFRSGLAIGSIGPTRIDRGNHAVA